MIKKILLGLVAIVLVAVGIVAYGLYDSGILRAPQYDTEAPAIAVMQRPAILVLSKTNGFIHKEGLPAGQKMLTELAEKNGWSIYQTENAATHNAQDLAKFDVVIWNNTSGDILTTQQRADFKQWMLAGGQWLGLHAAGGDPSYDWDWYVNEFLGAQFIGHTMEPQFQDADVLISDPQEPMTAHLPARWNVAAEEWYAFDRNPADAGAKVLMTMDESTYKTEQATPPSFLEGTELAKSLYMIATMEGEHPIAWTQAIGEGQMVYSAIGHQAATYSVPEYREFVTRAITTLLANNE